MSHRLKSIKADVTRALNAKGLKVQLDFVSLSGENFRKRVFKNIGEENTNLKMASLTELLVFSLTPYIGGIRVVSQKGLKVTFELTSPQAVGGGRLVNCQWDFNYNGERFGDKKYALNRKQDKDKNIIAKLDVEHEFKEYGEYTVASKVQDNIGGEGIIVKKCIVKENEVIIQDI